MDHETPGARTSEARMQTLEEAVGYLQHDLDGLRGHRADLDRVVESLERRLRALEQRVRRMEEVQDAEAGPPGEDEPDTAI